MKMTKYNNVFIAERRLTSSSPATETAVLTESRL